MTITFITLSLLVVGPFLVVLGIMISEWWKSRKYKSLQRHHNLRIEK